GHRWLSPPKRDLGASGGQPQGQFAQGESGEARVRRRFSSPLRGEDQGEGVSAMRRARRDTVRGDSPSPSVAPQPAPSSPRPSTKAQGGRRFKASIGLSAPGGRARR